MHVLRIHEHIYLIFSSLINSNIIQTLADVNTVGTPRFFFEHFISDPESMQKFIMDSPDSFDIDGVMKNFVENYRNISDEDNFNKYKKVLSDVLCVVRQKIRNNYPFLTKRGNVTNMKKRYISKRISQYLWKL